MVQRKVPNKIGIKSHQHKLDTQLINLRPSSSSSSSSSQTHEKLKKIMKKSRSTKRSDESRLLPPFRKKKPLPLHKDDLDSTPATPQKRSPNYMKSTSSFDARKEQSPAKTSVSKASSNSKSNDSASAVKGSRTSSLKMMRTLTKTPSFKPLRSTKKVILCEDLDAQRATCSSTLKDSKFPDYLQLNHGGTELDGTSAMKVCPYTYCSLNGHHHASVPPLKCFLSARRRALKTQKGFKLGCLSPRQIKPNMKKIDVTETVNLDTEDLDMEEENRDFFTDVYSKDMEIKGGEKFECSDIDWEEGCCSDSGNDGFKLQEINGGDGEEKVEKTSVEKLYNGIQELYDEKSVSSGAWSEEDGDSASDSSCEQMKIDQDYLIDNEFEVSSTSAESDVNDEIDELQGPNLPVEDQNINHQKEETSDFAAKSKDGADKNHTTIIYNIIQFNISVFINGEKTEHSEMDKTVTVHEPATFVSVDEMETREEAMEEQSMGNEEDEASEVNQTVADKELPFNVPNNASTEKECKEYEASNSMDEEPPITSDVDQTNRTDEITSETDIKTNTFCKKSTSDDQLPDPCINFRDLIGRKKPSQETSGVSPEFNPRGPHFLPETPEPDAETVDLRHQMMDERKNAEEWMVDFALQQAVTTLAPARKQKVALLVEAFEKVMPDPHLVRLPVRNPMYETHNKHASKAFTNSRPMQACS